VSYESVDFFIADTTPQKLPIAGVTVKILSQNGAIIFDQKTTNTSGQAAFMLPSDATYQARFYKQGVSFSIPQYFEVLASPSTNAFNIAGTLVAPPVSLDSRLCVAYGFFRTVTGAPAECTQIHIVSIFDPLLLDGAAVTTERVIVTTEKNGYVQVTLIRNGKYTVTVAGFENIQRVITVPDAFNVSLPDLLFPVVGSITFDPAAPFTLAVGQELTLSPLVVATDGEELGVSSGDVIWSMDDQAVAAFYLEPPIIRIRGISPGTTQLRAVRANNSIIRYPDPGILGVPASITVTP